MGNGVQLSVPYTSKLLITYPTAGAEFAAVDGLYGSESPNLVSAAYSVIHVVRRCFGCI